MEKRTKNLLSFNDYDHKVLQENSKPVETEEVVNEDHLDTVEDKVQFICKNISKLSTEEVDSIYKLVEDGCGEDCSESATEEVSEGKECDVEEEKDSEDKEDKEDSEDKEDKEDSEKE